MSYTESLKGNSSSNAIHPIVLYSELGHEAPFIASMILSAIDLLMRLVIIERSSAPKEWFEDQDVQKDTEKCTKTVDDDDLQNSPEPAGTRRVTWVQLLKQPRLIVSLALTAIVATVMSAFEVMLIFR